MIVNGKTVISDDIKEESFVCDLSKCKGACCVEGDLGAPVSKEELDILDEIYDQVSPYLSALGRDAIEAQGKYIFDSDGEYSTPTIDGKECAYAIYENGNILKCGIEKAWHDGKVPFQKPISCHLYPIRITQYEEYDALNYDRWPICSDACTLGAELKIPVYVFLKDALIRKYGIEWYNDLKSLMNSSDGDED